MCSKILYINMITSQTNWQVKLLLIVKIISMDMDLEILLNKRISCDWAFCFDTSVVLSFCPECASTDPKTEACDLLGPEEIEHGRLPSGTLYPQHAGCTRAGQAA